MPSHASLQVYPHLLHSPSKGDVARCQHGRKGSDIYHCPGQRQRSITIFLTRRIIHTSPKVHSLPHCDRYPYDTHCLEMWSPCGVNPATGDPNNTSSAHNRDHNSSTPVGVITSQCPLDVTHTNSSGSVQPTATKDPLFPPDTSRRGSRTEWLPLGLLMVMQSSSGIGETAAVSGAG
jgi:hypothetical protein